MKNLLVVVDENETTAHVLQAAVERAERERAALVVLHVMPQRVYERRETAILANSGLRRDGFSYTYTQATDAARGIADRAAWMAIGERAVPYTAVGVIGRPVPTVLAVAAAYNCDDIMIAATNMRWFGRVGRFDRTLTKQFNGTVTRVARSITELPNPVPAVPGL